MDIMKLINYITMNYSGYLVFIGIGKYTHKENNLYHKIIKGDIIKINSNTSSTIGSKATLVYS